MSYRKKPTGEEYQKFVEQYHKCDHAGKIQLAKHYKATYSMLKHWVSDGDTPLSITAPPAVDKLEEQNIIVNLPRVKLQEYVPKIMGRGDPETQTLVLGDDHAGLKTPSFDSKVYGKRFDALFQSTMTITELHRNMYPLNDLVIIDVGDNVQGENPFQGSTIGSVECGAVEQVYDLALPAIVSLLCSFKQQFKTIKFYGIRGNHGRYSRIAPATSNWDLALYRALAKAKLPDGIEIHYSDNFAEIVEIEGFRFFIFHSDQIKNAQYGIPYFALIRALKDWYVTFRGFPYAVCGHWHKEDYLRVTSETKLLINGASTTDDPFTLEQIKTSTIPNHWTFGVHKRQGLTWLYSLILDKNFLPHKYGTKGEWIFPEEIRK